MRDQICAVHHTKLSSRMHQEGSRGSKSQHQHTDKWSVSVNNPLRGGWCAAWCVSVIMMADWHNSGRSRKGGPGPPAERCWRRGKDGGVFWGLEGIILSPTGVSVKVCWTPSPQRSRSLQTRSHLCYSTAQRVSKRWFPGRLQILLSRARRSEDSF